MAVDEAGRPLGEKVIGVGNGGSSSGLLQPVVAHATTRGRRILAVNGSGVGLNIIAGDQYVAEGLPPHPSNTCGAYISGVLGVSTAASGPYCFFNLLSPHPRRRLRLPRPLAVAGGRAAVAGGRHRAADKPVPRG